jgi:UDP-N-acetylglucosamine 3-dehydrogenase
MGKIKVGIIGCGSIAQKRHLPEYSAEENVEIVAVCDNVSERADQVAEQYDASPYYDYKKLLQDAQIDAVSVCTPNYLHASITIDALRAGKHVLCEKPMATSKEEAEEMLYESQVSGKKLMIAHNQRFVPSHVKAKQLIKDGKIGRVYSFRTSFGHGGPDSWSIDGGLRSWFFKKDEAHFGAMGDLGIHKVDLIRYLLGEEIIEVGSFIETNAKENINVDDNAVLILKTKNGIIGTLAASWSYVSAEDNSTIIYGEKGIIRLEDHPDYSLIVDYKNGKSTKYQMGQIQTNHKQASSHVVHEFINSIVLDKVPPITGEEGLKSLRVILDAVESMKTKRIVTVGQ